MTRRALLSLLAWPVAWWPFGRAAAPAAAAGAPRASRRARPQRIGLALGSGGANGLAHILMLEAFEEAGVRPHCLAGSSIGAIVGALYASGRSAGDIREIVAEVVGRPGDTVLETIVDRRLLRWSEFLDVEVGSGGLIDSQGFLRFLYGHLRRSTFAELDIPLKVVATDFWAREQVVLDTGELLPAIQASMAIPGLFTPVVLEGRVLVDGGTVNPVPYDLLWDECDAVVAVDVVGRKTPPGDRIPGLFDSVFNTFEAMQTAITDAKRAHRPPAVYVVPEIVDIRTLEFYKAEEIYAQARPAKERLKRELQRLVG